MSKEKSLQSSPQLGFVEHQGAAVALSHKQIVSLYKKSTQSGIPFEILQEVYHRGYTADLSEQAAFNRVNSFISGGAAVHMDQDLNEKRGLWDNIHAKRERIKRGSGEHMKRPGEKGRPTKQDFINSQEEYTGAEKVSKNKNDASSRFIGTSSIVDVYKKDTPGYSAVKTIKKVVKERYEAGCPIDEEIHELIEEEFQSTGQELYEDWGEPLEEATKNGRRVSLGKPFMTPGGPKKRAVYVKNGSGNVVKVNFGDPNMRIKKNSPSHRKSFRARHHCDTNPGPRWKARYWSCRQW